MLPNRVVEWALIHACDTMLSLLPQPSSHPRLFEALTIVSSLARRLSGRENARSCFLACQNTLTLTSLLLGAELKCRHDIAGAAAADKSVLEQHLGSLLAQLEQQRLSLCCLGLILTEILRCDRHNIALDVGALMENEKARSFWILSFGRDCPIVPFTTLLRAYEKHIGRQLTENERAVLFELLGVSEQGVCCTAFSLAATQQQQQQAQRQKKRTEPRPGIVSVASAVATSTATATTATSSSPPSSPSMGFPFILHSKATSSGILPLEVLRDGTSLLFEIASDESGVVVFGGFSVKNCRRVAVRRVGSQNDGLERAREIALALQRGRGKNVLDFVGSVVDSSHLYIMTELLAGATLADWIRDQQYPPSNIREFWEKVCAIAQELCQAVAHLHRSGPLHARIAPDNIFLCGNTLKLGDVDTKVGDPVSLLYTAPELLDSSKAVTLQMDSWAVAAIVIEMIFGRSLASLLFPDVVESELENATRRFLLGNESVKTFAGGAVWLEFAKRWTPFRASGILPDIPSWLMMLLDRDPARRPSVDHFVHLFELPTTDVRRDNNVEMVPLFQRDAVIPRNKEANKTKVSDTTIRDDKPVSKINHANNNSAKIEPKITTPASPIAPPPAALMTESLSGLSDDEDSFRDNRYRWSNNYQHDSSLLERFDSSLSVDNRDENPDNFLERARFKSKMEREMAQLRKGDGNEFKREEFDQRRDYLNYNYINGGESDLRKELRRREESKRVAERTRDQIRSELKFDKPPHPVTTGERSRSPFDVRNSSFDPERKKKSNVIKFSIGNEEERRNQNDFVSSPRRRNDSNQNNISNIVEADWQTIASPACRQRFSDSGRYSLRDAREEAGAFSIEQGLRTAVVNSRFVETDDDFQVAPPSSSSLHQAAASGNVDAVRSYLRLYSPNSLHNGDTPLHSVARVGAGDAIGVARVLLDHSADVNSLNASGQTPLHVAASKGATLLLRFLLANGANSSLRNTQGYVAADLAVQNQHRAAMEVFRLHDAKNSTSALFVPDSFSALPEDQRWVDEGRPRDAHPRRSSSSSPQRGRESMSITGPDFSLVSTWTFNTSSAVSSMSVVDTGLLLLGFSSGWMEGWSILNRAMCFGVEAHELAINSICLGEDLIHVASKDATISLWRLERGKAEHIVKEGVLRGPSSGSFNCLVWQHARKLWGGTTDGKIQMWDVVSRVCVGMLQAHQSSISDLKLVSDSSLLISCSDDGTVKLWNSMKGYCIASLSHGDCAVTCLAVAEQFVFSGCSDGSTKIWDIEGQRFRQSLDSITRSKVTCIDVSSKQVWTGGDDGLVHVWDRNRFACIRSLRLHSQRVSCLSLSGKLLFTAGVDGSVKVWSIGDT